MVRYLYNYVYTTRRGELSINKVREGGGKERLKEMDEVL